MYLSVIRLQIRASADWTLCGGCSKWHRNTVHMTGVVFHTLSVPEQRHGAATAEQNAKVGILLSAVLQS